MGSLLVWQKRLTTLTPGAALAGLALLALTHVSPATANQLQGKVVRIADGDTVTLLVAGNKEERIRLAEIDAPESGQAFGNRSKQSLIQMCGGQMATVAVDSRDRYGRVLGRVTCNGIDTTREQVARGMAWVYDQYAKDKSLYALQDQARQRKLGLWADPRPVQPWEWRRGNRGGTTANAPAPAAQATPKAGDVRGNRNSMVYHLPHCGSYNAMNPRNIVSFKDEKAAAAAGYRKAGNCR